MVRIFIVYRGQDYGTGIMHHGASESYEDWRTEWTFAKSFVVEKSAKDFMASLGTDKYHYKIEQEFVELPA